MNLVTNAIIYQNHKIKFNLSKNIKKSIKFLCLFTCKS
jgi:hypothetical protein